jgi:hypothetical protein
MLFGNNPWSQRRAPVMQPMGGQPQAQPQTQVQPQVQQYAQPTWLGPTPDGTYAGGLANYYAGQLQNQMVPGSIPPPAMQPMAGQPAVNQALPPMPMANGGWRDAFRSALQDWRGQRPGFGGDFSQWRMTRPDRQSFRGAY